MAKKDRVEGELDERKTRILKIIIRNYLDTGEPVGSRTISKDSELSLSSATIRNEMSDLEEMGYIEQPHTSAGRIPSDKGYRFYVDELIKEKEQEISEVKADMSEMFEKTERMEKLLQQAVTALAENTNYTTMISAPAISGSKLKFIQLSSVAENQVLAVIVLDGNRVKNQILTLKEPIDNETVLKLNLMLNTSLNGLSMQQINLSTIAQLKEQAGIHSGVVSEVLDLIVMAIQEDDDLQVYTSGTTNIFKYPELADTAKASNLKTWFEVWIPNATNGFYVVAQPPQRLPMPEFSQNELRDFIRQNPSSQYRVIAKKQSYEAASPLMDILNNTAEYPSIKGVWLEDTYQTIGRLEDAMVRDLSNGVGFRPESPAPSTIT